MPLCPKPDVDCKYQGFKNWIRPTCRYPDVDVVEVEEEHERTGMLVRRKYVVCPFEEADVDAEADPESGLQTSPRKADMQPQENSY